MPMPAAPSSIALSLIAAISFTTGLGAQAGSKSRPIRKAKSQAELQASFDKKVAQDWYARVDWTDDFDLARQRAVAEGKFIFGYFTRTYSP